MANKIDTFGFGKINTEFVNSHLNAKFSTTPLLTKSTPKLSSLTATTKSLL